jgi:Tfp pilus assembly protein PilX
VSPRKPPARGIALITVLFILVVLVILVGTLLTVIPAELRDVAFSGYDNRALYAADAGIEALTQGLQSGDTALGIGSLIAPDGGKTTYDATVIATASSCGLQEDLIQSIGTSPAGDQREINAVVAQTTLSDYGLWVNNNPGDVYLVSGLSHYDGAVYLAGGASDPQLVDYIVGKAPIFDDQVTFAGNTVQWFNDGNATSQPSQTNSSAWAAVDAGGYAKVTIGGQTENYPGSQTSIQLANDAYGTPGGTSYPAPKGGKTVYLNQQPAGGPGGNLTSGIYVQGDSSITMTSSAVGSVPSTMTWSFAPVSSDQNSIADPVTVAVNYTTNSTTITDATTKKTTTFTGVPSQTSTTNSNSGIVYDAGNVEDVAGTYNGAYTLAVPDDGTTDDFIYVGNNVVAHDNPQTDATSADAFGLYANDIYIDDKSKSIPYNLTIQAALVTGNASEVAAATNDGTFTTRDNAANLPLYGTVTLYGSLAENIYGETYTFSGTTQKTGWAKNFLADPRFSTCPPPGSPLVSGSWHLVAWKDEGAP